MQPSDKQVDCWAEEMLYAIKAAGFDSEVVLFRAIRSEIKRVIAEAVFLAEQKR
jgi:hypothetical protein